MKSKLTKQQAKGCLHFLKSLSKEVNSENFKPETLGIPEDQIFQFIDELKSFNSYMELMINSNFSIIEIPERYQIIYKALTLTIVGQIVMRGEN